MGTSMAGLHLLERCTSSSAAWKPSPLGEATAECASLTVAPVLLDHLRGDGFIILQVNDPRALVW
jgi:hypothetical protein